MSSKKTAQLCVDLAIDLPRFAVLTPFPGTRLFQDLDSDGRILHRDWSQYDGQHVVFQPANMSVQTLQQGTEFAWRMAYSIPNLARRIRHTAAPFFTSLATNLAYRHYGYHLNRYYTCDAMIPPELPWPNLSA